MIADRERERMLELLATRATEGLDAGEARELDRALTAAPDVDPESFDRAAAAVHLALLGPETPMPEALERKIARAGVEWLASGSPPEDDDRRT